LDGIGEDDITPLDDFQCYVKLSLGGHPLPVFSLVLDAPPPPDEGLAQFVRLRSRGRDARPAGAADELIRQSQTRQRSASPSRPRAMNRREEDDLSVVAGDAKGGGESTRRHKKRGSGSHDGEVMCFLETGQNRATQLVFNYEHPPQPPRPSLYYHMEKQLFNRAYWHIVPQGLV